MSDPLSIVLSITALASTSANMVSVANKLIASRRKMPTSISRIRDEITQLNIILDQVLVLLQGHKEGEPREGRVSMCPLHTMEGFLRNRMANLETTLNDAAGLAGLSTARRLLIRIKWVLWKEAEARDLVEDLQRQKLNLHTMLTIIQWYVVAYRTEHLFFGLVLLDICSCAPCAPY